MIIISNHKQKVLILDERLLARGGKIGPVRRVSPFNLPF